MSLVFTFFFLPLPVYFFLPCSSLSFLSFPNPLVSSFYKNRSSREEIIYLRPMRYHLGILMKQLQISDIMWVLRTSSLCVRVEVRERLRRSCSQTSCTLFLSPNHLPLSEEKYLEKKNLCRHLFECKYRKLHNDQELGAVCPQTVPKRTLLYIVRLIKPIKR